ncbi:hypothetical protein Poli38472_008702 [Pythium oligandrum]|uniref:Protein kinase domain-containing protein n=1 Tax=Pythium oligandrum TaxID=41045 RepID=A0A8K1FCQ1_PYTOL|nr:hypothetical protein Poli38472_008702 [Pythium oligandrum]|eukprot:TMW56054.1 hypothetical protein Poli38472_008702 [Pythium oligandrum]
MGIERWDDDYEYAAHQPQTEQERLMRVVHGVQCTSRRFDENSRQNVYELYAHQLGEQAFHMHRPLDYFATAARDEEEETKSEIEFENSTSNYLVAVFFDPTRHLPSNEPIALTRTGLVQFAYHFAQSRSKKRGESVVSVHPVVFRTMDRAQLTHHLDDVQREQQVLQALRPEGFRKSRPYAFGRVEHVTFGRAYDHFPQWRFLEDAYNQYLLTDFAFNGSLVQYAAKRLREFSIEVAHLAGESRILDGNVVMKAVQHLWREEALSIFAGLARAVSYMHANGVCHLDLNPQSIAVDAHVNPMIVNFSSAEPVGSDGLAALGRPIYCKAHFAPHEIKMHNRNLHQSPGVNGKSADMYSLGVLLFWLLFVSQGNNESGQWRVLDPVQQDPNWNGNLVDHIQDASAIHDQCVICLSHGTLDSEIAYLLRGLLANDPYERVSAEELGQLTSRYQLQGDMFERCERAFRNILTNF